MAKLTGHGQGGAEASSNLISGSNGGGCGINFHADSLVLVSWNGNGSLIESIRALVSASNGGGCGINFHADSLGSMSNGDFHLGSLALGSSVDGKWRKVWWKKSQTKKREEGYLYCAGLTLLYRVGPKKKQKGYKNCKYLQKTVFD